MSRKLAVFAVFTLLILGARDRAGAQTIGRSFGPGGGVRVSPVGPLGGLGGTQNPLDLSTGPVTPDLRGVLPVIQTPKLELPPDSEPTVAVTGETDRERRDTPVMPFDTATSSAHDVRQNLAEVNEDDDISQQQAVMVSGSPSDNEDDDDDDDQDEGDIPWWVWLLCMIGAVMVVSWLRD